MAAAPEAAGRSVGRAFEWRDHPLDPIEQLFRGELLAGAVAYALGIKSCGALNVEFYTGVEARLAAPVVLPPLLDEASVRGKRILLVDDVSDSGHTLALSVDLIRAMGAEVQTVTLYTKPRTVLEPDFFWRRTPRWIVFPWSALPPGGRLVANAVTIETEAALFAVHARRGGTLTRLSVERLDRVGSLHGFRPSMTITQYAAVKP